MKTQPTFHEIDEQHAALMRACSLPTYQELCNLNEELLAALNAWEYWYSGESTEFNRDAAREQGLAAIAKATQS